MTSRWHIRQGGQRPAPRPVPETCETQAYLQDYGALLEYLSCPSLVVDRHWNVVMANSAFETLFHGVRPHPTAMPGENFLRFVPVSTPTRARSSASTSPAGACPCWPSSGPRWRPTPTTTNPGDAPGDRPGPDHGGRLPAGPRRTGSGPWARPRPVWTAPSACCTTPTAPRAYRVPHRRGVAAAAAGAGLPAADDGPARSPPVRRPGAPYAPPAGRGLPSVGRPLSRELTRHRRRSGRRRRRAPPSFTQAACVTCARLAAMTRRLAEVAKKVGVSEATVSRVLNGKPGVSDATRQAVLTALDVLGYERPTQLRGERARLVGLVLPELQNPIFPAFAEVIGGALAQLGLTRCCARRPRAACRRPTTSSCCSSSRSPVSSSPAACTPRPTRRTTTTGCSPSATSRSCWSTRPSRTSASRGVLRRRRGGRAGLAAPGLLGHERIGLVLGPGDHVPSARKLAAARAVAGDLPEEFVARAIFSSRAGTPPPPGSSTGASPASSAPPTRWHSAPSGPPAARGTTSRAGSPSSATTTRRS